MKIHPGELIVGVMMICFVSVGVIVASKATDVEMELFSVSLAIFGVLFLIGQIRRQVSVSQMKAEQQRG